LHSRGDTVVREGLGEGQERIEILLLALKSARQGGLLFSLLLLELLELTLVMLLSSGRLRLERLRLILLADDLSADVGLQYRLARLVPCRLYRLRLRQELLLLFGGSRLDRLSPEVLLLGIEFQILLVRVADRGKLLLHLQVENRLAPLEDLLQRLVAVIVGQRRYLSVESADVLVGREISDLLFLGKQLLQLLETLLAKLLLGLRLVLLSLL